MAPVGKAARDFAQSLAADVKKGRIKPVYFRRLGDVSLPLLHLLIWISLFQCIYFCL